MNETTKAETNDDNTVFQHLLQYFNKHDCIELICKIVVKYTLLYNYLFLLIVHK